jgi:hypothetical protein
MIWRFIPAACHLPAVTCHWPVDDVIAAHAGIRLHSFEKEDDDEGE